MPPLSAAGLPPWPVPDPPALVVSPLSWIPPSEGLEFKLTQVFDAQVRPALQVPSDRHAPVSDPALAELELVVPPHAITRAKAANGPRVCLSMDEVRILESLVSTALPLLERCRRS